MTFSEWNIRFILFTVGNTLHIEVYEVNGDDDELLHLGRQGRI